MKTTFRILIGSFAIAMTSNAANIQVSSVPNLSGGAGDILVVGVTDDLLSSGFVGSGGFSIDDTAVTTLVTNNDFVGLISAFSPFVGTDNFSLGTVAVLGAAVPGGFTISVDPFDETPFIGQTIYTFIGNGSDLASSTAFALFKHDETLVADPAPPGNEIGYFLDLANGDSLIGTFGTKEGVTDANLGITDATVDTYKLVVAIPEPSAVLLSSLGLIALLRRKR